MIGVHDPYRYLTWTGCVDEIFNIIYSYGIHTFWVICVKFFNTPNIFQVTNAWLGTLLRQAKSIISKTFFGSHGQHNVAFYVFDWKSRQILDLKLLKIEHLRFHDLIILCVEVCKEVAMWWRVTSLSHLVASSKPFLLNQACFMIWFLLLIFVF